MAGQIYSVIFGSTESEFLRLDLGRVFVEDPEPYRGVETHVTLKAGGFTGSVRASLFTTELRKLLSNLEETQTTLAGEIQFDTLEGQISFTVTMTHTGGMLVSGVLMDAAGMGNTLNFELALDQSFLPRAIVALQRFFASQS